jgi:uncharacterized repeat protein (TIGR03803 family)
LVYPVSRKIFLDKLPSHHQNDAFNTNCQDSCLTSTTTFEESSLQWRFPMHPHPSDSKQLPTAAKRIVLCCGCVGFSLVAMVWFGLFPRIQGAENILPDHQASTAPTRTESKLLANYSKLPLSFEPNQGQVSGPVKFLSRGRGYTIFLTDDEAVLTLRKSQPGMSQFGKFGLAGGLDPFGPVDPRAGRWPSLAHGWKSMSRSLIPALSQMVPEPNPGEGGVAERLEAQPLQVVRMRLVGGNAKGRVVGLDQLPGRSNYFIGNDPKKWRTNVPSYARVKYQGVYPGVDLVYYGNQRQLEYDFVVAPGADPGVIALRLAANLPRQAGSSESELPLRVTSKGDLWVAAGGNELRFLKPVVYQVVDGRRVHVAGRFALRDQRTVGFRLGHYDPAKALVIDPVLIYSTYLGGSASDAGNGIAVDSSGNAYIIGNTTSVNFPTVGPLQGSLDGSSNVFVAKLNAAGSALVYSTYLGGDGTDYGDGIAVDSSGSAYLTGATTSINFPTLNPIQANLAGTVNVFVAKLSATGSSLVYSTYLGGSRSDNGRGIAVDSSGNAYVCGMAQSYDFPVTANAFQTMMPGYLNPFVAKLNAAGTALAYSTYLGGNYDDEGTAIAVDASGNAYVTGNTNSESFPTVSPFQAGLAGAQNAFVSKLNSAGSALIYSTYLGGSSYDGGQGIAVDSSGSAYVTGYTESPNFPTLNPIVASILGDVEDAFVTKLNPAGSTLVYSTYLGSGGGDNYGSAIAVDSAGDAYVAGQSGANPFTGAISSTTNAIQANLGASTAGNAFIAELSPAGSELVYWTYLGGSNSDSGNAVAVDSSGNVYVAGTATSTNFPTANPLQATLDGPSATNAFVAKIGSANSVGIAFGPGALTFASQDVGIPSSTESITLTAAGTEPLTITSISVGGDFALTTTATSCPYSGGAIAAGESCTIDLIFSPTAAGSRNGKVTVVDNASGSPQSVILLGTGFIPPPAATPNFSIPPGTYNPGLVVAIADATPGAAIYYTTNGAAPTTSSTLYTSPIQVNSTATIQAIAAASGYSASAVAAATYTITVATLSPVSTPTFSPPAGTYTTPQMVAISDATAGAIIYYTTDGTTPTTASTQYTAPVLVISTRTFEAIAAASGHATSAIATATYTINLPTVGEWVWMSGSSSQGPSGVYGTLGTPAPGNVPGGRESTASWSDALGNLWLFGGFGLDYGGTFQYLNDLWQFNPSTGLWAWMGGSNTGAFGLFGTQGIPAAGNMPGGREVGAAWTDKAGNFWLFGGWGYGPNINEYGDLNDLWKYNPSLGQWTWISGSSSANQAGVYGTLGTFAAGNVPGARGPAGSWIDPKGNLWIFGGFGYSSLSEVAYLNDIWEFNPASGQWAWMGGSSTGVCQGTYGTLGTPASGNTPGARVGSSSWTDSSGNLWLFGGNGCDSNDEFGSLNDIWEFNPATSQWAWMGGSSTMDPSGVYGTEGTPAAGNAPGGRDGAQSWVGSNGNFWLFGGWGFDSAGSETYLNDLWIFDPSTLQWTWVGGSNVGGQPAVYGTLGIPAATNNPGGREAAAKWTDSLGNLWLFGGEFFNDLWEYQLTPSTPIAAAPTFSPASGTYSSPQTVTISDATAGATIYYTTNGTTPSTSSTEYTGPITVSSSETIEAIATASGYSTSALATATYTISGLPQAAAPTFSPVAGTYTSTQTVTISDATPGATIYYAINAAPSTSSSKYSGPIQVNSSETIEAIATASSYTTSAVATATYTINIVTGTTAATPTFSPPPGVYTSAQTVTISDSTAGATIYYTTNGSTPTTNSAQYTSPLTVSSTETIEAVATARGFSTSAMATAIYTISSASPLSTLLNFTGSNGASPWSMSFVQGADGNFYGTTMNGGTNNAGTVFKITPGGALTTLYDFCTQSGCEDGSGPMAGLVLGTDGNFYGTTLYGGTSSNDGTVFKITPGGTLTTLYRFSGADGANPGGRLLQATDGNFYGTTASGGTSTAANCLVSGEDKCGTLFKITPAGALTTLYSFNAESGFNPDGGLIQATDGNLYGTTLNGGASGGGGTVFKISLGGTFATIYNFCSQAGCTDGTGPYDQLVQASNGNFYGTTAGGGMGTASQCDQGGGGGYGTVFELTPGGTLTTLHTFANTDGSVPDAGLVQATDGNFYGTTACGGANSDGTVFKITSGGVLTTLYSFAGSVPVGADANGGLMQATNGNFYGSTTAGGTSGEGTVFSLNMGLGPFVETLPASGGVGAGVIILGTNLTGATGVSFNGAAATFTVVSSSEIETSVPAGASTGVVTVKTPASTLSSDVPFQVTTATVQQTATPSFSVASGTYSSAQTVTISDATPGATIYYTTNGTTPTTSSTVYTGAITVSSSETIEAIATAVGYSTSAVATASYTISSRPLAAVSPATLTFAALMVNSTSSSQAVTLSNTGTTALAVAGIATSANFAQTNNCGSSVAGLGSCTINVTFTPQAGGSLTGTLTITDNSNNTAGSIQTVSLSGTGEDFTLTLSSGSSTSASVAPGSPATYTLSVGSVGGLSGNVSFTCTGAPSEANCTVSPNPVTAGSTATNLTVKVTTTAPSVGEPRSRRFPPALPLSRGQRGLLMLALVLAAMAWASRRRHQPGVSGWQSTMLPLAAGLLLTVALAGCGGGGGGGGGATTTASNPGTPAGTYTLTVTGSTGSGSSTVSHSVTLTLTVS